MEDSQDCLVDAEEVNAEEVDAKEVDAEEVDADSLFGLRVQVGVDPLKEVGSLEEAGPLKEADRVEEVDLATEELLEVLVVSFVPGVLHFVWP